VPSAFVLHLTDINRTEPILGSFDWQKNNLPGICIYLITIPKKLPTLHYFYKKSPFRASSALVFLFLPTKQRKELVSTLNTFSYYLSYGFKAPS